ncbi:MAG TPA: hypothetical protein VFY29_07760, partial [Terriglobia bacterium]|nr:hypothetical protein [Terriglobia bacterium]
MTRAASIDESISHRLPIAWIVRLRYGMILGEVALMAAVSWGFDVPAPWLLVAAVLAIQLLANAWISHRRDALGAHGEHWVGALFILDAVVMTLILGLTGGPLNP